MIIFIVAGIVVGLIANFVIASSENKEKKIGIDGVVTCEITNKSTRNDRITAMRKTFIDSGMDKKLIDKRIRKVIDGNNEATKLSNYDIERFEYIKHADLVWVIEAARCTAITLQSEIEIKETYNKRVGILLDSFPNSKEIDDCLCILSVKLKNIYRMTKELEVLNNRFKELTGRTLI